MRSKKSSAGKGARPGRAAKSAGSAAGAKGKPELKKREAEKRREAKKREVKPTVASKTAKAKAPAKAAPAKAKVSPAKAPPPKAAAVASASVAEAPKTRRSPPVVKPASLAKARAEKLREAAVDDEADSVAPAAPAPAPALKGPTPPRLTVRTPAGADELKQKINALATATQQIRTLKRTLARSFYDIGLILRDIEDARLFEVKGYGSFEAFLEREIDLGKIVGLRLVRVVHFFQKEAAVAAGLDRVGAAIPILDGEAEPAAPQASPTSPGGVRSPIPFHKL